MSEHFSPSTHAGRLISCRMSMKPLVVIFASLLSAASFAVNIEYSEEYVDQGPVNWDVVVLGLIAWAGLIGVARLVVDRWNVGLWGLLGFYLIHLMVFWSSSGFSDPLWLMAIVSIFPTGFSLVVVLSEF